MATTTPIADRAASAVTTHKHPRAARRELDRFVSFAELLGRDEGLRIEPFQRLILLEVFAGRRELLVLIPRGNGKTSLFGLLALWHLLTHRAPRVYLAAASRDQADIAFEVAKGYLSKSASLRKRVKAQHRRLVRTDGSGYLRVISSDAGRQHGLMPTLALVDELHAHKNGDLYVALKTAMGKNPEAQLITISTAGHDDREQLGQLRAKALSDGEVEQGGERLRIARIHASNFCMLEWALRDGDPLDDPEVLKLANPASFVTVAFLLEQIHSPGLHPVELATYHANVWRSGIDSWLPPGAWDLCERSDAAIRDGADVVLGVDIGIKHDSSAVTAVWHDADDDRFVTETRVFEPREDGGRLDLARVEEHIREWTRRGTVLEVVYDPHKFERSAQTLSDEGLLMVEFPQVNERLAPASARLYEAILTKRVVHNGDPVLAAHVVAGVVRDTERGWRLSKGKATRRIDALMALVMAFARADVIQTTGGFEW